MRTDSDYLTPEQRSKWPNGSHDAIMLWRSHAVADDVARELAGALRQFMPCSCGWCEYGPDERCPTSMTLARYDALVGDA